MNAVTQKDLQALKQNAGALYFADTLLKKDKEIVLTELASLFRTEKGSVISDALRVLPRLHNAA